jgi:polyisoprenoid-binding protein YceI
MKTTKWIFDPTHSELTFKIKHLMITNVSGSFQDFTADLETNGDDLTNATIRASAKVSSVSTNNTQRDQHLLNSDFFEADAFPTIDFISRKIEKTGDDTYKVTGDLTMKGVTNTVELNVEYGGLVNDPWGNKRAGFVIDGKINRSKWGMNFNGVLETGGLMLGDEVRIHSEVELIKEAVAATAA